MSRQLQLDYPVPWGHEHSAVAEFQGLLFVLSAHCAILKTLSLANGLTG